ncbi:hypothetical protein DFP97_1581, partial [Paenibacillus prosopidis]
MAPAPVIYQYTIVPVSLIKDVKYDFEYHSSHSLKNVSSVIW